jgi:hypothetical protein
MMRVSHMIAAILTWVIAAEAHPDYVGYSGGQPGRQTCAMSCHGADGASVSIQGFPATYVPEHIYTLNIFRVTGDNISNFNASVRIGTGMDNAGVIGPGTATSIYNVPGETNGVHFTSPDQASGSFTWTAPPPQTGTVRLYGGAHQGNTAFGPNTEFLQVSHETPPAPGQATNPYPADGSTDVLLNVALSWTPDTAATSHDVRIGTTNPPDFVANTSVPTYSPENLAAATLYYWRIDERNDAGVTLGTVWQFTTESLPGVASNPQPADSATGVPADVVLSWTAGHGAASHSVYFGTSQPLPYRGSRTDTTFDPAVDLLPDSTYFWRIDEVNSAGSTSGQVWQFTVYNLSFGELRGRVPQRLTLGPAYPNPFNATLSISYDLPSARHVTLRVFDLLGCEVTVLKDDFVEAGTHHVVFDGSNLASGIYFARLDAGKLSHTSKLVLLK